MCFLIVSRSVSYVVLLPSTGPPSLPTVTESSNDVLTISLKSSIKGKVYVFRRVLPIMAPLHGVCVMPSH